MRHVFALGLLCSLLAVSGCGMPVVQYGPYTVDGPYGPPRMVAWGEPVNGLQLGLEGRRDTIVIVLKNVGDQPLVTPSYTDCGNRREYDWYRLLLIDSRNCVSQIMLESIMRDASQVEHARIEPGDSVLHVIDLSYWATAELNVRRVDVPNRFRLLARYRAIASGVDYWRLDGDAWQREKTAPATEWEGIVFSDTIGVFVNPAEPAWVENRRAIEEWLGRSRFEYIPVSRQ